MSDLHRGDGPLPAEYCIICHTLLEGHDDKNCEHEARWRAEVIEMQKEEEES